jgi:hypothetical protein
MIARKAAACAAAIIIGISVDAASATALAQDGEGSIPEPPRLQMNMQPVGQSLSQLLDAGYRVIDFSLVEGSEALFVVMRNGHHVMCFVERAGYSQCMALH